MVVGEFEDYALMREFAREGYGVLPVPNVLQEQVHKELGLMTLGPAKKVQAQFYAISTERRIKHPAVLAICEMARRVFSA